MKIEFYVHGEPKPQPRPRAFARNMGGGKFMARIYDAGTAENWKGCVALAAKRHRPERPIASPLFVEIRFFLPRPKGHLNSKGLLRPSAPLVPVNKMDCDNMAKAVLDCLTQIGMWEDDGQVVRLHISKSYADLVAPMGAKVTIEGEWEVPSKSTNSPPAEPVVEQGVFE